MAVNGGEVGIKVGRRKDVNSWRWKVCRIPSVTKWRRMKQAEARVRGLEAEIETRSSEYEELKEKYEALELALEHEKKKKVEDEAKGLRRMSHELSSTVGKDWLSLEIRVDDFQVDRQLASRDASQILATPGSNLPGQYKPFIGGEKCGGPKSFFPGLKICPSSLSIDIDEEKSPESSLKSKINDHCLEDDTKMCINSTPCAATPIRKSAVGQEILYRLLTGTDWEFSEDLVEDFNKDDMLCMMAVCTLYRKQTPDERTERFTLHRNGRGFSQAHAPMGSLIAEFLTDGDPDGDMKRNVDELRAEFPDGVETCREIALYHARQLFDIYENDEDPFW